jgi:hypothetical protein
VQQELGSSLVYVRQNRAEWDRLVREVDRTVQKMPLWKLQTVGEERLDFLYENKDRGNRLAMN